MNPLTSLQPICVRSRVLTLNALSLGVLTKLPAVPTLAASSGTRTLIGILHVARADFTATLLTNGQVLVVGGLDSANNVLASAKLYIP
jgi:hypothetical protein